MEENEIDKETEIKGVKDVVSSAVPWAFGFSIPCTIICSYIFKDIKPLIIAFATFLLLWLCCIVFFLIKSIEKIPKNIDKKSDTYVFIRNRNYHLLFDTIKPISKILLFSSFLAFPLNILTTEIQVYIAIGLCFIFFFISIFIITGIYHNDLHKYKCPYCKEDFVPDFRKYPMKQPICHKCKKQFSLEDKKKK